MIFNEVFSSITFCADAAELPEIPNKTLVIPAITAINESLNTWEGVRLVDDWQKFQAILHQKQDDSGFAEWRRLITHTPLSETNLILAEQLLAEYPYEEKEVHQLINHFALSGQNEMCLNLWDDFPEDGQPCLKLRVFENFKVQPMYRHFLDL